MRTLTPTPRPAMAEVDRSEAYVEMLEFSFRELEEQLIRAHASLLDLADRTGSPVQETRLRGKAEGVLLGLDYLRRMTRLHQEFRP